MSIVSVQNTISSYANFKDSGSWYVFYFISKRTKFAIQQNGGVIDY